MVDSNDNSNDEIEIHSDESFNNISAVVTNQGQLDDKIKRIEQNRKNIRTIIKSSLQISGYLLTVTLGAVYFGYSDSGKSILPLGTKLLIFVSSICFPISIFTDIWALRLKTILSIETESQVIELEKVFKKERFWTNLSITFLLLSVFGLIGGMFIFTIERTFNVTIFNQAQFLWLKELTIIFFDIILNLMRFNTIKLDQNQLVWLQEIFKISYNFTNNFIKYSPIITFRI